MNKIDIPEGKTGDWLIGCHAFEEGVIGEYDRDRDECWTWELRGRTIHYTDGAALAVELDGYADLLRDMGDNHDAVVQNPATHAAVAGRMASIIDGWADKVRQ